MSLKVDELSSLLEPLSHNKIYTEFFGEAKLLAKMLRGKDLYSLFAEFNNFQLYLRKRNRKIIANSLASSLSGGTNIIKVSEASDELESILTHAQIAACCELFKGWSFDISQDIEQSFSRQLEVILAHLKTADESTLNNIHLRIATADTVRVIIILKLLGLLRPDTSKRNLLSFGAASGVKELYSTHTEPGITATKRSHNVLRCSFTSRLNWPSQTILIDYDDHWRDHYQNITTTHAANVFGIIGEFDKVIAELPATCRKNNLALSDLVTGWRIDHQIMPDVPEFFRSIMPSLTSKRKIDYIVSIGAGDDDADYAGREQTMNAIWAYLKSCNLSPVRLAMHGGGRNYPLLGYGGYATYEVIYCSLDKKKIK